MNKISTNYSYDIYVTFKFFTTIIFFKNNKQINYKYISTLDILNHK